MAQQQSGGDSTFRVRVGPVEAPVTLEVHAAAGDLPPWDLDSPLRSVKGRHPRLEAPQKVTGRARYTSDVRLPGMLWARMVRAPIPAGRIVRIDTAKAERLPGVKAVWTTDARQAGAPVKLLLDRREEQVCSGNGPGALMTVRLGATADGTLTAIHYRAFAEGGIGAGSRTGGPAASIYPGCPSVKLEEYDVFTNAGPACALRAPGHPQGAFGLECAMDELAHRLGLDPLELRRKNESHPFRKQYYDVGAKAIGWERRSAAPGAAPGPRKRGLGMANGNWYVLVRETVAVEVQVHRDGSVELFHGAQDLGTGIRTVLAVIAAEELGLRPADITVHVGDTRFPPGGTSGGSTTTNSSGPAARLAAHLARMRVAALAAPLLQARPDELAFADGTIFAAADPARKVSFREAARKMPGEAIACLADRKRQFETVRQDLAATQFAEVEVDVETGRIRVLKMVAVSNCGIPINPLTAESQVIGAQIQGASWALFERRTLDRSVGTMVNPNLEAYKILGPADMFEPVVILTEGANAGNNTSATGIAEPVFVPTLAAIANAVFNATGVRLRQLPLTPDRVLAALAGAGKGGRP